MFGDDSHIAEYGIHAELYAKNGIYTKMFNKQAKFYRNEPGVSIESDKNNYLQYTHPYSCESH